MHYSTRLRWIKPGLDEELAGLRHLLSEVSEGVLAPEHLEEVRHSLARIRGVLELISVYGAVLLVEEMEALVVSLTRGRVEQRDDGLRLLMQGVLQLPHYLERVQRSGRDIPVLLMPLLNDIRAVLRRRLLSETSLFSPDLTTVIPDLPLSAVVQGAVSEDGVKAYAKRLRTRYQKGLVDWFRDEEGHGLGTLAAVLRYLERLSGNSPLGTLWWVALGAVAALRDGSLPAGVSIKLLLGQIDLQIRELAETGVDHLDHPPPPELMKNLLFYVGRFRSSRPRVQRIAEVYRLDDLLPEEDEDGFLGPGLEVLDAVNEALSDDLSRVKEVMDIFVRSEAATIEDLRPTIGMLSRVADTLALLGLGGARHTVREQIQRLTDCLEGREAPDTHTLLAIAGQLLEVDAALSALASRGLDEALRADRGVGQIEALEDHHQRQLTAAAVGELRVDLVTIKEHSEAFIADPGAIHHLDGIQEGFQRVVGGLRMLDLGPLADFMSEAARYVRERLRESAPQLPSREHLEAYADTVMSADYFLEGYLEGRQDTDEILDRIRAAVAALELPPDVDVDEELDFADNNEDIELAPPPPERLEAEGLAALEVDEGLVFGDDEEITLASFPGEAWTDDEEDETPAEMPGHVRASLEDASARLRRLDHDDAPAPPEPEAAATHPGGGVAADEAPGEEIVAIFLEEAEETLAAIAGSLERWQEAPQQREPLGVLRRSFHTLKGSGRLVGALHVGELAGAMERLLNRLLEGTLGYRPAIPELLWEAHGLMPELVAAYRSGREAPPACRELIRRAEALVDGRPPGAERDEPEDGGEGGDGEGTDSPGPLPGGHVAAPVPASRSAMSVGAMDAAMLQVFLAEAEGVLAGLQGICSQLTLAGGGLVDESLVRHCHTLKGITRLASLDGHSRLYGALEIVFDLHRKGVKPVSIDGCVLLQEGVDVLAATLDALRAGREPEAPEEGLIARARTLAEAPISVREVAVPGREEDELAAELREVFVEEAEEIQQSCDQLLEKWQGPDVDAGTLVALQRHIHTLKGGARMAELTALVALSHSLETLLGRLAETRVSPSARRREVIQQGLDAVADMLDEVRSGRTPGEATALVAAIEGAAATPAAGDTAADDEPAPEPEVAVLEHPPVVSLATDSLVGSGDGERELPGIEKVAVEVNLLDHLVSTSGEISISRSRVEQQVGALGSTIKEMEQTIGRLRSQLRRLEIETESQILFRHERAPQESPGSTFDPLELDRYTEAQQLSRGLTESVSDLESIQGQLTDLVRDSEAFLLEQARLSCDLQERLLTTRLVPVARYIPRLRRLVRQTAKELHKKVELHVRGHDEELDHTIIGPLVGALEHMLNNAVDHGIETPEERHRRGKPAVGRIDLAVERDHGDIVIHLRDDGAGMDREAIRARALERGLMSDRVEVTDAELVQFVFEQSFSTVAEVTRISGRGVGLDVVNAAINQLGGSLTVDTNAGIGTGFVIRLPTTLSVSQALMVQIEEERFAVPLSHLEGVMRLSRDEATVLLAEPAPALNYLGETYQLFSLACLLGVVGGMAPSALVRRVAVLFVRVGDRRMAFLVDALGAHEEVVIKPVGPQIGTVSWILGATVMGDGRVVLVFDLPALVRLAATRPALREWRRAAGQETGRPPLVLVVDDSLTVRRVAERFLERNGMEVLTARDGLEALALLEEHAPDVMLLDIEMPRMDGYELATSVRNDARLRHLPIIMITSRSGHKHSERARSLGVNHYLNKPYQEFELLDRIHALTAPGDG
ncbi:MAG: Hpt domain-containing protein [Gammaproteobacteria bacterium]|nr:Hpt domain-containing protein [Gammaproteobacteria bacterium]